jgi:hypothetical protein
MMRWALPLLFLICCVAETALCQDSNPAIYSEIIPTSSGLPYDAARDALETFQAPNGKSVAVLVKGPIGSGTYSRAIGPGETPDAYFPAVVSEAVAAKAHHLVIPRGVYKFQGPQLCTDLSSAVCQLPNACSANAYYNCAPHWTIGQYPQGQVTEPNSITDLDIDFSGSELDFAAPVIGIWILEAQRLRLRNFIVDWPELPIASLGTIVHDPDNKGHNALVLDAKYPVTDKYEGGAVQIQAVDIWDPATYSFGPLSNNTYETYFIFGGAPQPTYVGATAAGEHTFSCKSCHFQNSATDPSCSFFNGCANFDGFAPGTRVVVRHYTYNGFAFLVNWSNDIDFQNVQLRTGPGIGFSVSNEGGYRGFRLYNSQITRGAGRLISTASDAIDLNMKADMIVEGNNIGYQGDDSINLYSATSPVLGAKGSTITIPAVCSPDPMDEPILGDDLAVFDSNEVYKGTARVVKAQGPFCGEYLTLTLDHAVPGTTIGDNVLDLTEQPSARYVIRDNIMHDCRCHGALVNAPYGSIDNNWMYANSAEAIQLSGGNGVGPAPTNLNISYNLIDAPGESSQYYGAITMVATDAVGNLLQAPVFEKIHIENNLIWNTPGPALLTASARYFNVGNNLISNTNQTQSSPTYYGSLPSLDSLLFYQSSYGTVCGNGLGGSETGPIGIDPLDARVIVDTGCSN